MAKLNEIEGIGETFAGKLADAGVKSVDDLLEKCATPKDRKAIAEAAGIGEKQILRWANMADLFRIKGVGEEYADLLEAAGVDTVPELGQRNAANLFAKMTEINEAKNLVRALPTEDKVSDWIAQAKKLDRKLEY
jgi:predicted flap endonuclease-1-like 5' DNA nuclease